MSKTNKLVLTQKRNEPIYLPLNDAIIIQPNRVTNGRFEKFSLYQTRILVAVMFKLQEAIKADMGGMDFRNLELFDNSQSDIHIAIPFKEIAQHTKYLDVEQALEGLRTVPVSFKSPKEGLKRVRGLITGYDVPYNNTVGRTKYFYLSIDKGVAEILVKVDKKEGGTPINFTKYFYAIAMNARCQYTAKFYMIISSWKVKGGFVISVPELKHQLGIGEDEYPNFANFRKGVLLPVQKDLEKHSDCWFNCSEANFEIKDGRKVTHLNIKVISPELKKQIAERDELLIFNIKTLLERHLKFTKDDIYLVMDLIEKSEKSVQEVFQKLTQIISHINDKKNINNKVAFAITSIKNYFSKV